MPLARVGMLVYKVRVEENGVNLVRDRGSGVRGRERISLVVWLEKRRERKSIQQESGPL